MKLEESPNYFYTHEISSTDTNRPVKTIHISKDFFEPVDEWCAKTKISPCFRVIDSILDTEEINFREESFLFFIGPLPLTKIDRALLEGARVWLGYGLYNIIISITSAARKEQLVLFLEGHSYRHEYWQLHGNIIDDDIKFFVKEKVPKQELSKKLLSTYVGEARMFTAIKGYYSQILTICERLRYIDKDSYLRMVAFHQSVEDYIDSNEYNDPANDKQNFNYISSINACLTRYNSQLNGGFSPLMEHQISVCGHSFFGVGMAGLGINNLGNYFYQKIGTQYIIPRFVKILETRYNKRDKLTEISVKDSFWKKDLLKTIPIQSLDDDDKQQMQLLTYFSTRDGFRNQYNTLSVPLIALYGCNTAHWSLKTLSHEASHLIVNGIFDYIFRNKSNKFFEDLIKVCKPSVPRKLVQTFEDAVIQLFGTGLIAIETMYNGNKQIDADTIEKSLETRHHEMKEIMTHAFDFLYYYNSNLELYIEEIWSSWGELPNMESSIQEYITRCLCIIVLHDLDNFKIEDEAVGILKRYWTN